MAEALARERLGIPRLQLTDEALERIEALIDLRATPLLDELGDLPAEQREAVHDRVVAGRPYSEIARRQRTTEANVRQRVARGLARLRVRIGGAND